MKKIAIAAGLAMALSTPVAVQAQVPGYVVNSDNTIWRTRFDECWHTGDWSKAKAVVDGCDGYVAQVAPAPMAAPAPAPTPVVADVEKKFASTSTSTAPRWLMSVASSTTSARCPA